MGRINVTSRIFAGLSGPNNIGNILSHSQSPAIASGFGLGFGLGSGPPSSSSSSAEGHPNRYQALTDYYLAPANLPVLRQTATDTSQFPGWCPRIRLRTSPSVDFVLSPIILRETTRWLCHPLQVQTLRIQWQTYLASVGRRSSSSLS